MKGLCAVMIIFLLWLGVHLSVTIYKGFNDDAGQADVIVVLGARVEADGRPNETLARRLDKALELYKQGASPRIIVSGSPQPNGHGQAETMGRYLASRGVPPQNIIEDPEGYTTWYTARNTHRIMREHGWKSAIAVSNYYHLWRCNLAFANFHIPQTFTAHANLVRFKDAYWLLREFAAYYYYLVRSYPAE